MLKKKKASKKTKKPRKQKPDTSGGSVTRELATGIGQAVADIIASTAAARLAASPSPDAPAQVTNQLESQVFVTKQFKKNGNDVSTEESQDKIAVHKFATEPARVMVEYGLTMNMGNFESARLSVAVTLPCYREEVDSAHAFAAKWAGDRLAEEVSKVKGTPVDKTEGATAPSGSSNNLF